MNYSYKAVDRTGEIRTGTLQAATQSAAVAELGRMQMIPVDLKAGRPSLRHWLSRSIELNARLSTRDVVAVTQGLGSLLKSGLVLDRALHIMGATSNRRAVRILCLDLERRVRSGATFGDALSEHGRLFPPYYIVMAKAGELGGLAAARTRTTGRLC